MELEKKIEAVLFWKGEPMSHKKLCDILKCTQDELNSALGNLKVNLVERGVVLMEKEGEVTLGTAPEFSELIDNLQKDELNKELSKASLETLSIIVYKNGASRAEIDYIRGVNSSFILRALSVRGLVEKTVDTSDSRKYVYKPTFDLLSYLGVTSSSEMPDYSQIIKGIDSAKSELDETTNKINNETN